MENAISNNMPTFKFGILHKIVIFFAVFSSIMGGAKLFGVSVSKISLIPLLLILVADSNYRRLKIKKQAVPLLIFYLLALISCLMGLTMSYANSYLEFKSTILFYIVQIIVFFIPILVLLSNSSNKEKYFYYIRKFFLIISRINLIIVFAQFLIYQFTKVDIGLFFLSFYGGKNSIITNIPGYGEILRCSGILVDPAFFGFSLIVATMWDTKKIWKFLYFLGAVLAVSRSAIVVLVIIYLFKFLHLVFAQSNNAQKRKIMFRIFLFCIILMLIGMILITVLNLNNFVTMFVQRFTSSNKDYDGTSRHTSYPKIALDIVFNESDFFQLLFGRGPRTSGTAIVNATSKYDYLMDKEKFFHKVWATECDVSELLLGYGIMGSFSYYFFLLSKVNMKNKYTYITLVFMLFGVMYNISSLPMAQLIYICIASGFFQWQKQNETIL